MPRKILSLFIIGLALRLAYVVYVPQLEVTSDAKAYTILARNVAEGNGYALADGKPHTRWPPGYPLFISAVYKIFGIENNTAVRIAQAILTSLLIVIVYLIAKKIFNPRTGFIAGLLMCFYPAFITYSGFLTSQTLAAFLLPLFVLWAINFRGGILPSVGLGIFAGYSSLVRPELLLCFMVIFAMLFFKNKAKNRIFKFIVIMFSSMCLVVSMWTLRNYRATREFIPISTHLGSTVWQSTWEGDWQEWRADEEPLASILKGRDVTEADRDLLKAGINNLKKRPFVYLKLCVKRLFRLWAEGHSYVCRFLSDSTANYFKQGDYFLFSIKLFLLVFNTTIVSLGFLGIWVAYKKFGGDRGYIGYAAAPIWYFVVFYCFTFCTGRYSVPVLPLVIIFASCAIGHILNFRKKGICETT